MTYEEFDKYQDDLLAKVVSMKNTKGREYANSEDRFANFNRLSERLGISNLSIAWVFVTKHLDSLESYIKNNQTYSTEPIEGRLVDIITYMTLIGGMIREKELAKDNLGFLASIYTDLPYFKDEGKAFDPDKGKRDDLKSKVL